MKQLLVREGARLVHSRGFTATGVAEVALVAGIPKGSFFNHFQTKQEFAKEVLKQYGANTIEGATDILSRPFETALDGLTFYFNTLLDMNTADGFRSGCLIGNFAGEANALELEVRDELAHQLQGWTEVIASFLRGWMDRHIAEQVASALLDSWHGALLRAKADRSSAALERFLSCTLVALLKGTDHAP